MAGSIKTDITGLTPAQQLSSIHTRIYKMYQDLSNLLDEKLIPKLNKNNIYISTLTELNHTQRNTLTEKFNNQIFPVLTPLGFDQDEDNHESIPKLPSHQIIIILKLQDAEENSISLQQKNS